MISTRGRYAIRVMIDLAENNTGNYIPLKDIAERQEISKKYLEQIVGLLTRAGLLKSSRGAQGGYKLARENVQELILWKQPYNKGDNFFNHSACFFGVYGCAVGSALRFPGTKIQNSALV